MTIEKISLRNLIWLRYRVIFTLNMNFDYSQIEFVKVPV